MSTIQVTNINDLSDNAALATHKWWHQDNKLTGKTMRVQSLLWVEGNIGDDKLAKWTIKGWCGFLLPQIYWCRR